MKSRFISIAAVIFLLLISTACSGKPDYDAEQNARTTFPSQFIVGDVYILKAGETIDGNLAGVGTSLVIEAGSNVLGDISLVGSFLEVSGQVNGNINVLAGSSEIMDTAVILGNINHSMQKMTISPNAKITGEINSFTFSSPAGSNAGQGIIKLLEWLRPARLLMLQGFRILGMMVISFIAFYLFEIPTDRVSRAIKINPAASWGAGILAIITIPVIALVMLVSICLSPIGIGILGIFAVSYFWGWAALSLIMGQYLNKWLKFSWQPNHIGLVSTLILAVLFAVLSLLPCIGALMNVMISSIGLGGVILSRFGTSTSI